VLLPHIGRPIFNASGAMGSGKTTLQRLLKRLVDPTAPETVRFDPRDFLQKAGHASVLMLDNQNTMPEWAADTTCRLVTGEADSKRRLYTDDEDVIIELRRAVLLNGINVPTDRGDVLDRSLVVELERIPDAERKTEEELWERFEAEHPKLLGALFDVLSKAIALKPSIKLSRRPRLADWGEYAAAVYEVMGWGAEAFLKDWDEVVKVQNQATLDGSPVAQAIIKFMEDKREHTATSSKLHKTLEVVAEDLGLNKDKAWPKSARWLWKRIKEVLPVLAAVGIEATRGRDESAKQITLRKVPTNDGSNGSGGQSRPNSDKTHANRDSDDGISNGRNASNGISNGSENPAGKADSANTANTANRYGDSWQSNPMRHYRRGGAA
jgi:energy-coupling factor transporter ATP-binding protein EcfA2